MKEHLFALHSSTGTAMRVFTFTGFSQTQPKPCITGFVVLIFFFLPIDHLTAVAATPTVGHIERLDPRLDDLIPADATIDVLAMGFAWSEGPVWVTTDAGGLPAGSLLFSDIPRNRIHRWHPQEGLSIFLEPSGFTGVAHKGNERGSNGLGIDAQGRLLCCEHGDRRLSVLTPAGGKRTLADAWQGKRFNSPNDLAVHSSGAIYFTDPPYGLPGGFTSPLREIDYCGVYRLKPTGEVDLLCPTMTRPNGIAFSPDEKKLYVAQSDPQEPVWKVFTIQPDGSLDAGKTFFDARHLTPIYKGNPDGLTVDTAGNLFATGPGGVLIISPDGTHLGTLITEQKTANCCFGGDGKTLFITAHTLLCRVRLTTSGW
jgi:gluconolactonase